MKCLQLIENIYNEKFRILVDYLFSKSSYFTLCENGYGHVVKGQKHARLLKSLAPYLVTTVKTNHWFCYYVTGATLKKVYVYSANEQTKKLLLGTYDNLFLFDDNGKIETPEDLCFFKENTLFWEQFHTSQYVMFFQNRQRC